MTLDLIGQMFGQLTVIEMIGSKLIGKSTKIFWRCKCNCGNKTIVAAGDLHSGHSQSCGCIKGHSITHGEARRGNKSVEWQTWYSMIKRCTNPNHSGYKNYGGRGIKVCKRWSKYEQFLADMGRKPSPEHSIDRINNNGNYTPGNCRWATTHQQMSNQRPRKRAHHG